MNWEDLLIWAYATDIIENDEKEININVDINISVEGEDDD